MENPFNIVADDNFPSDLRQRGKRIVAKDETPDGGAVLEAYQMPNGGPVYITRILHFHKGK